jgi:hypothetical protein
MGSSFFLWVRADVTVSELLEAVFSVGPARGYINRLREASR